MNLDSIKFGNPPKEQDDKVKADRAGILKAAIEVGIIKDVLENHPFPSNSSDETKTELEYLVKVTKEADDDDFKFCKLLEHYHYDFLAVAGAVVFVAPYFGRPNPTIEINTPALFFL